MLVRIAHHLLERDAHQHQLIRQLRAEGKRLFGGEVAFELSPCGIAKTLPGALVRLEPALDAQFMADPAFRSTSGSNILVMVLIILCGGASI
jgi:hypothetical protein